MDPNSFFDLKNRTAIVTGGGNGIGKGACETLAAFGANVVVSDLKLEDAEAVASGITEKGGKAVAVACKDPFALQEAALNHHPQRALYALSRHP